MAKENQKYNKMAKGRDVWCSTVQKGEKEKEALTLFQKG